MRNWTLAFEYTPLRLSGDYPYLGVGGGASQLELALLAERLALASGGPAFVCTIAANTW